LTLAQRDVLCHVDGSQRKLIQELASSGIYDAGAGHLTRDIPIQPAPDPTEAAGSELMSANVGENASPFVDQLADGPGVSRIDPSDPAAPMYRLLAMMRSPVALRDLMIQPVRTGYIGQEKPIDPAEVPKSAAELYPDIRVSELDVPSPLGRIRCQVFSPPGAAARAMMLYAHGGGFTLGQSEDTAYITSRIAAENAMVVVSANYRLAPEWPFPACLDDCLEVLRWMQKNAATIGGDAARNAVGGDSAGGNLAAALPIKARDAGVPMPQAAVLLAPITDFFFEQYESFERLAPLGIVYDAAFIGFIRSAYLVHGKNWAHPHASPARADLRGYPAAFIVTGTADPLVDDNRAFAGKLRGGGVTNVEHLVCEGMPHGFYFFPGMFRQGDEAFTAVAKFLARTGMA
jgi:acetyl esterase